MRAPPLSEQAAKKFAKLRVVVQLLKQTTLVIDQSLLEGEHGFQLIARIFQLTRRDAQKKHRAIQHRFRRDGFTRDGEFLFCARRIRRRYARFVRRRSPPIPKQK